jgi:predicted small integral membrane protein
MPRSGIGRDAIIFLMGFLITYFGIGFFELVGAPYWLALILAVVIALAVMIPFMKKYPREY